MFANSLGQTLLVESTTPFEKIAEVIQSLGWTREENSSLPSLVKGEPEFATWTWEGLKPFVIYTFNPVAKMRVLDVSTLPPLLREQIAKKLPLMTFDQLDQLFNSEQAHERLLAIWATQELERTDWMEKVGSCKEDPEPIVAQEAASVSDHLQTIATAQINMLTQLRVIAESAVPTIAQLSDPQFAYSLKPNRDQLSEIFDPHLADAAYSCTDLIYQSYPHTEPMDTEATIETWAAPAGLLRWPNNLAMKFPLGYRDMAGWMNPKLIWLTWKVTYPKGGTVHYDGLVWFQDRWFWLPKIFRLLTPYLMAPTTKH